MANKYIVDANVFIQGKNFHYDFAFCGGFWDWIAAGHAQGVIFSIQKVKDELLKGRQGDAGRTWAQSMPPDFFVDDVNDAQVMAQYGSIIEWSQRDTHYHTAAKTRFAELQRADAFLLACAKAHGFEIVTQEQSNPDKKREIPIPDAAKKIGGIRTLTIYELLTQHAKPTFVFKR